MGTGNSVGDSACPWFGARFGVYWAYGLEGLGFRV